LLHYRDNWYLEAWCHLRAGLRTFALDSIRDARMLETAAEEIGAQSLHDYSAATYGIFSGNAERTAVLRFRPERARWVAAEQWHPNQQSHWLGDGRYELKIPYSQTPELVMDILKYGPDVEVVEPKALRELVGERLRLAAKVYSG
ncbi:MAG: WYL domain-containing protein, partial [Gammaproteobacteria bacterium]|nr:WYL domain-containing protein [Gammaproteobacteria bacterium]